MEFKRFKEGKKEIKTERNNGKMIELEIPVGLKNCWWWGNRGSVNWLVSGYIWKVKMTGLLTHE